MQINIVWIIAACVALTAGGCASSSPKTAAAGQKVFSSMQQATALAGKKAAASLALVKVEKQESDADSRSQLSMIISRISGGQTSGIVLTPQGHILAPGVIKPDEDNTITVLIGENEYSARAIKANDALGMTILKLDSDEAFVPLDLTKGADLAVGEWAVVLKPTDEDMDYQVISTPVACQGEKGGRYRRFLFEQSLSSYSGALAVNLSGQVVGVAERGGVLSINDLREDLQRFIAEAIGKGSSDDAKKKGWFGAILSPVNKDYAKARKIPISSLTVLHVAKEGPAAAAGLHDGDMITALNGKPLRFSGSRAQDYFNKSLQPRIGEKFSVSVLRDNKTVELSGTFAKAPETETLRAEDIGVTVSDITDSDAFSKNLSTDRGVLVTDVQRGSPAANSGTLRQTLIAKDDIIVELAGQPTPNVAAFSKTLESIRQTQPQVLLVKYRRGLLTGYAGLNLTLGEKSNESKQ